jgi:hypothetical protein
MTMLAPCRRLSIRWFAILLNFCEIFAQRYVAAPDHSPDTAIHVGDVERHTRLGARLSRSTSACWPDLQVSLILTTTTQVPRPSCRGFFCAERPRVAQFARPLLISNCQSLITPGGNSRSPAPARRQASGHMSSRAWSRRNSSLCDTSPVSELGHWSAAIFSSSISGGMSLSVVMVSPHRCSP